MRFSTVVATALWAFKSWDVEGVSIVCDPEAATPGDVIAARTNAQYLGNIMTGEQPLNGAGPENCGQVACNWGTAFEWCNDTPQSMELDNFTVIADAFNLMNSKLTSGEDDDCVILTLEGLKVAGEVFHPDGFSVRIRGGANC